MRILGFSKKWDKLQQPEFTTFRFTRKDRDWQVGEVVQVVYKPRSKNREILGVAEIIAKEPRWVMNDESAAGITPLEAIVDGFKEDFPHRAMRRWLVEQYPLERLQREPMNKLTLRWCQSEQSNSK